MSEASSAGRLVGRLAILARVRLRLPVTPKGLARFLTVGACGLSVDLALLWLLERGGTNHAAARAISLLVATLVTWALNRQFTFGISGRRRTRELGRYALVALVAQGINYLIFLGVCAAWPRLAHTFAALAGAATATIFSYTGHRFFSFAPGGAHPRVLK